MLLKKVGLIAAGAFAAGALALGGASVASAATATPTPSTSTSTSSNSGRDPGASSDTPVTGDELAKVSAAMKAKDSTVTVSSVRKDPDGSYDVLGTKAGSQVMYDVSADLTAITESAAGSRPAR